jgi:hypothetical protein
LEVGEGGGWNAADRDSRNARNEKWKTETKCVRKKMESDRLIYPLLLAV